MDPKTGQQIDSLHGETAARRQAVGELLFFASIGDLYRVKRIVAAWTLNLSDPKTSDYDKRTPLHLASSEGCYSVVSWLLSQGVEVNPVDRFKRTPLEDAVRADHGEVATILVQAGGKVMNKEGEMVELNESPLSGARLFEGFDPEWEIDASSIKMMEKVGEGEFGVVHKAIWVGTIVAVKILKDTGAVALGDFRTELNLLQKVHHTHTVQFLGAVTKTRPYMIVTEYMPGGSLLDSFKAKILFTTWRAVLIALDMARGMAYLHNRLPHAVIHRDLKPANLMLGGPKVFAPHHRKLLIEELGVLKIADFGLSKSLKLARPTKKDSHHSSHHPSSSGRMTGETRDKSGGIAGNASGHGLYSEKMGTSVTTSQRGSGSGSGSGTGAAPTYRLTGEKGSYRFMAPEVYRHEQYNNKVDVYSFAMIAYQLFEGVPPFYMLDPIEAARAAAYEHRRPKWGISGRPGHSVPIRLKALVESCWAADPDARPEFEDVVADLADYSREIEPDWGEIVRKQEEGGGCCSVQ